MSTRWCSWLQKRIQRAGSCGVAVSARRDAGTQFAAHHDERPDDQRDADRPARDLQWPAPVKRERPERRVREVDQRERHEEFPRETRQLIDPEAREGRADPDEPE